jgi:hypothetical protein
MVTKIFAASVLALGIASSAMAQSSAGTSHRRHHPVSHSERMKVDPGTTGSINRNASTQNSNGNRCGPNTLGPDAHPGVNVNDQYCNK